MNPPSLLYQSDEAKRTNSAEVRRMTNAVAYSL